MTHDIGPPPVRHRLADRLFHWVMAVSTIVLGATAFLPILGIRFGWVPWHWTAGIVLTLSILFHFYRVAAVHGVREMLPGYDDAAEGMHTMIGRQATGLRPAKYDVFQKGYHWATAIVVLTVVATGLLMLARIDTTFWQRNPSILSDANWGIVYVLHGASALVLLFLVILHVYFGLLPEHRQLLFSMFRGTGPQYTRKES